MGHASPSAPALASVRGLAGCFGRCLAAAAISRNQVEDRISLGSAHALSVIAADPAEVGRSVAIPMPEFGRCPRDR